MQHITCYGHVPFNQEFYLHGDIHINEVDTNKIVPESFTYGKMAVSILWVTKIMKKITQLRILAPIMGRYIKILKTLKLSFLFNDKKLLLIKICRNVEDDSYLKKRKIR